MGRESDGLNITSSQQHTFSILAFDQRGNYHKMLPAGTSHTQVADIKREVVVALSPHVTAVLLDPNYGLPAAIASSGGSGLLMALEKTGYSGDSSARRVDFMKGKIALLVLKGGVTKLIEFERKGAF